MDHRPQPHARRRAGGVVVALQGEGELADQRVDEADLGDLRTDQHQDPVAQVGLLPLTAFDAGQLQPVGQHGEQRLAHADPAGVVPLLAPEALDVDGEDIAMDWLVGHIKDPQARDDPLARYRLQGRVTRSGAVKRRRLWRPARGRPGPGRR
jgi:hypothetical protein